MNWTDKNNQTISQHIVDHYHAELREFVPEILRIAQDVEKMHADHEDCPHGVSVEIKTLWEKLSLHLEYEENILFPFLATERANSELLLVAMREHTEQCNGLSTVRKICNNFVCPKDASKSWSALYKSLEQLEEDLMEHIHLENNILFERVLAS